MAAPIYTTDLTTLADGETSTGWAELASPYNAGGSATLDPDYYIQNSNCISQSLSASKSGLLFSLVYDSGADQSGNFNAGDCFFMWHVLLAGNGMDLFANGGMRAVIGLDQSNFNAWFVGGSDFGRNPYGGWQNIAVDPTYPADQTVGTPGTTYQWFGSLVNTVATISKGNLHGVDAIRYGRGELLSVGGDLGNGYATFLGMASQNDSQNNRWGLFQEQAGTYLWKGLLSLGTTGSPAQAVDFRDANRVIVVDDTPRTYDDFNKIEIKNVDSNVQWTNIQISALGTLSPGTFEVVDNATVLLDTCIFTDMGTFTFLSNSTIDTTTFRRCDLVTQNGATINECVFVDHSASTGSPATVDAALFADDLSLITNTTFIGNPIGSPAGSGHAIELGPGALAGSPTSFNFSGNKFENFGETGTTDAAIYNNTGSTVIINILGGGDTPTYRNGPGSVTIINNAVTITVRGLSEGAAVKLVANETVGTWTLGNTIYETLADANGVAQTSINYEAAFDPSGLDIITRCRASGLPTAAIQDDNGVFTDETTAANSAVAADMNLLPAVPVVNQDRYLFGHAEMFGKLKIDINTPGTGNYDITWQYWNGSTWADLTGVIDGTVDGGSPLSGKSFSAAGLNYVEWTIPGDWATTTINSQGPYYYIRAAYTAGTVTTPPTGTRCSLDVTKYLPFVQSGTVTSDGLTVTASWVEDTIAKFKP